MRKGQYVIKVKFTKKGVLSKINVLKWYKKGRVESLREAPERDIEEIKFLLQG